jgi:hypothetical protein
MSIAPSSPAWSLANKSGKHFVFYTLADELYHKHIVIRVRVDFTVLHCPGFGEFEYELQGEPVIGSVEFMALRGRLLCPTMLQQEQMLMLANECADDSGARETIRESCIASLYP